MSYWRITKRLASSSEHKIHHLGCVIVKGGNIISTGYNKMRYTRELQRPTLHAEADAILKILKDGRQHQLAGSTLYVSRYTKGNAIGLAKPCDACMSLIRSVGIGLVYYTNDCGTTSRMKL